MKKLLILLLTSYCFSSFSQEIVIIDNDSNYVDSICAVRGHIKGGIITTTDLFCPPYIIDNDSVSIMVYPACNYISYVCLRCRRLIEEREKERRVVIWRKEEK